MPEGLQVWDATGNLVQDIPNRLTRLLGVVATTTAAGSLTDARFATGTPFYQKQGVDFNSTGKEVTFSGTTMSWTAGNHSGNIRYGVY